VAKHRPEEETFADTAERGGISGNPSLWTDKGISNLKRFVWRRLLRITISPESAAVDSNASVGSGLECHVEPADFVNCFSGVPIQKFAQGSGELLIEKHNFADEVLVLDGCVEGNAGDSEFRSIEEVGRYESVERVGWAAVRGRG